MTTTTVDINGNLLEHDALLQGYRELLELAKSQLEQFEISPDDWRRLESKVIVNMDYYQLSVRIADLLERALRDEQRGTSFEAGSAESIHHNTMLKLLDRLAEPVLKKVREQEIQQEIRTAIHEAHHKMRLELLEHMETVVNRAVERRVDEQLAVARSEQDALRNLLLRTIGTDLRSIAADAVNERLNALQEN